MARKSDKQKGIFFFILGSLLLIVFAGTFLLRLIGILIALSIINYGLYLQQLPPLHIWIKYHFRFK